MTSAALSTDSVGRRSTSVGSGSASDDKWCLLTYATADWGERTTTWGSNSDYTSTESNPTVTSAVEVPYATISLYSDNGYNSYAAAKQYPPYITCYMWRKGTGISETNLP